MECMAPSLELKVLQSFLFSLLLFILRQKFDQGYQVQSCSCLLIVWSGYGLINTAQPERSNAALGRGPETACYKAFVVASLLHRASEETADCTII